MEIDLVELVDSLPGLVWTSLSDGSADFLNRRWLEFTGIDREDALGVGWHATIHPDDLPVLLEHWTRFTEMKVAGEVEARMRRHDGVYRRFLFSATPFCDKQGNITRWCGINTDIEERSRVEHTQVMRQITEAQRLSQTGSFTADVWADRHNWSEELYRIFEIEPHVEISVGSISAMMHQDDRTLFEEGFAHAVANRTDYDHSFRIITKSGVLKQLHAVAQYANEIAGRPLYIGAIRDVTASKASEEALKNSEANLRRTNSLLTEAQRLSKTGSFTWDLVADEHEWSEEIYRIFGIEVGIKVSMAIIQAAIHPHDLSRVETAISSAAEHGLLDLGFRIVIASDQVRYAHVVARRMEQIEDRIVFLGALQDVTDQKLGEAALIETEKEVRRANSLLTEAEKVSQTGSYMTDLGARDSIWSDELYRIYGLEPAEKISVDSVQLSTHPEDRPIVDDMLSELRSGADYLSRHFRIVTPTGVVKHVHCVARRNDQISESPVFVGAIQDVTERKMAEVALNQARAELAHVARMTALSALTASIAHEVNQPLAGIITNASTCLRMLGMNPPDLDGAMATAQRTIRDGNRASAVIQRLRGLFTRNQIEHTPVNLSEIALEVLTLVSSELQRQRIVVRSNFGVDIPPAFGDRVQLQQVIMNLIMNAADAMSDIDYRPRIIVIIIDWNKQNEVTFTVQDSGIGIEPSAIERLFDPFFSTKSDGMGIGLSVSRSIIESHQGQLMITDTSNLGTTFAFSLPVYDSKSNANENKIIAFANSAIVTISGSKDS